MSGLGESSRYSEIVRQVTAALAARDINRAVELSRAGIDGGVLHPLLFNVRSHWHERRGEFAQALADMRQSAALAPGDALAHFAYGDLLTRLGNNAEATKELEESIRLNPNFAPAHHQLGLALSKRGRPEESRASYARATELDPSDAGSYARLAELAYRRGDWADARRCADMALAIEPGQSVALVALAGAAVGEGDLDRAEELISGLRARSDLAPLDGAIVAALLGDLRQAQQRHAEAFVAWREANAQQKAIFSLYYEGSESMADYAEWLTAQAGALDEKWRVANSGQPVDERIDGARALAFVIGFPRSGTTLVQNVLTGSPDVVGVQERTLYPEAVRDYLSNAEGLANLAAADTEELRTYRALYWKSAEASGIDVRGKLFVDNHPFGALRLLLVARLFPAAKVVFVQRDPRDVLFSSFHNAFTMSKSTFELLDLERAARFYDTMMRLAQTCRDKLGLEWHTLRYESLVDDFDGETKKLCAFLGLEWTENMRDFAARAKAGGGATLSGPQLRSGLNRASIGSWRHYRADLAPALPILEPWVAAFGYPES